MLKRMILKKITITALTLFILLLIYLMPTNKINNRNLDVKQNLEYTYTNDLEICMFVKSGHKFKKHF